MPTDALGTSPASTGLGLCQAGVLSSGVHPRGTGTGAGLGVTSPLGHCLSLLAAVEPLYHLGAEKPRLDIRNCVLTFCIMKLSAGFWQ